VTGVHLVVIMATVRAEIAIGTGKGNLTQTVVATGGTHLVKCKYSIIILN